MYNCEFIRVLSIQRASYLSDESRELHGSYVHAIRLSCVAKVLACLKVPANAAMLLP